MIVFEFPAPAPLISLNQHVHWRTRYQREGLWQEAAWAGCLAHTTRSERPQRRSTVSITLPVRSLKVRRDPHNFVATVKPIVDGLVHAGLWPDDTAEYVVTREPAFWTGRNVLVEIHPVGQV